MFGEETGEFVSFTVPTCARLLSFSIVDVKQPHLGESCPSNVHATLRLSLKDLNKLERKEWIEEIEQGTPLYLVGFERREGGKIKRFEEEYGIKLVRGVTV